jgi:hypothetical protein
LRNGDKKGGTPSGWKGPNTIIITQAIGTVNIFSWKIRFSEGCTRKYGIFYPKFRVAEMGKLCYGVGTER